MISTAGQFTCVQEADLFKCLLTLIQYFISTTRTGLSYSGLKPTFRFVLLLMFIHELASFNYISKMFSSRCSHKMFMLSSFNRTS